MFSMEFLLTSLIVVLIPGTGVIYTVSNGLFLGWRASVAAAVGCTAGIVPHLCASVLGLSAIMHVSAVAFQAVKYAGAAYLLYLAWIMWRETGALSLNAPASGSGAWRTIRRGFLINILNPKLSVFFLAFLPLFVPANAASPTLQMLILSGVFMLMTFVVFVAYGISASAVRKYVINSPRVIKWMQRTFAMAFAALGLKLAAAEQ